ncbi:MAG TPA: hypothetical protein VEQ59_05100, partial [Polyangiaceae bacterium]|nr:hypothetical protein [Polyangiaceae bacterium]
EQTLATKRFRAQDCQLAISRLRAGRVLIVLEGRDLGHLGREPFQELEKSLETGERLDLFFDLRGALGATLEASGSWAVWLRRNQRRLRRVSLLTARPVIGLSAQAVVKFSQLGSRARLYSDAAAFESALLAAS